jgi:hypothetical protein
MHLNICMSRCIQTPVMEGVLRIFGMEGVLRPFLVYYYGDIFVTVQGTFILLTSFVYFSKYSLLVLYS